ncbi:inactive protein RESTRICTED TEV MOVEMENT 2-like [Cocos nucifera]|nr:inactive protein RESTRICTED TEV MOVEMENT 2-like [Cocos nucifera]
MDSKKSPGPTPSYEDFDPDFEWSREEGSDTLRVHLPGFKRDNLRVEVDDYGNLMTSGERALDSTRRSRFRKEFRIPENCNVDDIHAKFENSVLYVIHPKVKTTRLAAHPQDRLPVAQTVATEPQREPKPKPAAETKPGIDKKAGATVLDETAAKQAGEKSSELSRTAQKDAGKIVEKETDRPAGPAGNGKVVGVVKGDEATDKGIKPIDERRIEPKTQNGISDGGPALELTKPMQPLLNVAVAILVLMCLAMYVAYKLGKAA